MKHLPSLIFALRCCHQTQEISDEQINTGNHQRCGESCKTGKTSISRYLNGEKHLLSDALLARIEQAIADLDYRPSLMARGLKHGRTRLIGLIIADITNPYSVNVLSGIEAACRDKGFTPLVCNTNNEVDQELHYLDLLRSYQSKGLWSTPSGCAKRAEPPATVCAADGAD